MSTPITPVGQQTSAPDETNITYITPEKSLAPHCGLIRISIEEIDPDGVCTRGLSSYVTVDYAEDTIDRDLKCALRELLARRTQYIIESIN